MTGGTGRGPKKTNWANYPKKRCKKEGCKKRIKTHPELGICNKCFNEENKR